MSSRYTTQRWFLTSLRVLFLVVAIFAVVLTSTSGIARTRFAPALTPILRNQDCLDFGEYLHWAGVLENGSGSGGVVVRGDYAYMAAGSFQVVDISDPYQPVVVGSPYAAYLGVAVAGIYAFTLFNPISTTVLLAVIDITDPTAPFFVSEIVVFHMSRGVTASQDHAYVIGFLGLQVYDFSDPTSLNLVGELAMPWAERDGIAVGSHVYIADSLAGLRVVDVSDPASPFILSSTGTPGDAQRVVVTGDFAYVADGDMGLQVIDVADPAAPFITGSVDTPGSAFSVAVSGDFAYVADQNIGIQVIDVSNPALPQIVSTLRTISDPHFLAASEDVVCVQVRFPDELHGGDPQAPAGGLQIIDISNPYLAPVVGSVDTPTDARGISVVGDIAYVADLGSLQVVDVADPALPSIVGSVSTPGYAYSVAVSGSSAFVAVGLEGLRVVDVADPDSPSIIGSVDTPGNAYSVSVAGDKAYVADGPSGLQVIDIVDPAAPSIIASAETPGTAYSVAVSGNYAYVADGWIGIQVVDISSPEFPSIVGAVNLPDGSGEALSIAVSDDWAFVAAFGSGFHVVDISNPGSPTIVTSLPDLGLSRSVTVADGYAYLVVQGSGVLVLDVSSPLNPSLVGTVDATGLARAVAVSGNCAYVASGHDGLRIFSRQCEVNVPIFLSSLMARPDLNGMTIHWAIAEPCDPGCFRLVGMTRDSAWEVPYQQEGPETFFARDESEHLGRGAEVVYSLFYQDAGLEWILLDTVTVALTLPSLETRLVGIHPNPFNPLTTVDFSVNRPQQVAISVYDMCGRLLTSLDDRLYGAGTYSVDWDGRDAAGRAVSSGTYLIRMKAGGVVKSQKVMLVR